MIDPRAEFWDEKIETISRDELANLQLQKLQWQVQRCWDGSEFYRARLEQEGATPSDIQSLDDVRKIPIVTKQELRDEQLAHPPYGRYTVGARANWSELHPSTGTTGVPVSTIWSQADCENITQFTARTMWSFGVRPGAIVQNAFAYGLWVAGMSVHYAVKRMGCFVIPIGAALTNRQIDYLLAGSTVLLATPSYALHIAEALREHGVAPDDIALELGCFGGEAGTENASTRGKIERGLGIDAYDYYGLAEIGPTFASECVAKAGIHWAEDHHLIEIINPDTMEPCAEGEIGVVVITHLSREATPMLRYWSNDYARYTSARCDCGRTHGRSLGGIMGRHDDLVIYRGAKFYPVQVEKVVRSFGELSDEFRIELARDENVGTDRCTVVAEVNQVSDESVLARLRSALREELLVTPGHSVGTIRDTRAHDVQGTAYRGLAT